MTDIKNIDFSTIKKMTLKELEIVKENFKNYIKTTIMTNSGHLGSNLSNIELTLALHYVYDANNDHFFFDISHQSYTHKLLTKRYEQFQFIYKNGLISGFQNRKESIYDPFEAVHAGTSLGYAIGFTYKQNLESCVCIIGDAAFQNGFNLESLIQAENLSKSPLLLIFNDNNFSIDPTVGALTNNFLRVKKIAEATGFEFISLNDGHNLKKIILKLNKIKKNNKNTIFYLKTQKAAPHKVAIIQAENQTAFASYLNDIFVNFLNKSNNHYIICPGTKLNSGLANLKSLNIIDTGISEGLTFLMASGMSLQNKQILICIYSTFLARAFGQIIHDILNLKLSIIIHIQKADLIANEPMINQGIFDLNFLINLPNLQLYDANNHLELKNIIDNFDQKLPLFIRTSTNITLSNIENENFENIKNWKIYFHKKEHTNLIISYGDLVNVTYNLLKNNQFITLANAICLTNWNEPAIKAFINNFKNIYVVEEVFENTGLYAKLLLLNCKCKFKQIALPFKYYAIKDIKFHKDSLAGQIQDIINKIINKNSYEKRK